MNFHWFFNQSEKSSIFTLFFVIFIFQIRTVCVNASLMNQADKLDEKQMASVSIAIVLVFVTSNFLQNLYFVLRYYKVISPEQDLSKYLYPTSCVLTVINSSVNVIIYGILDMKFKNSFLSLFRKQKAQERSRNTSRNQPTSWFWIYDENMVSLTTSQSLILIPLIN